MERRTGFKISSLITWWDNIESSITRLLILLFIILVIVQGLMINQSIKTFLSTTEKLEGKSVSEYQPEIKKGDLELTVQSGGYTGNIDIYVNGDKVTSFYKSKLRLNVKSNDVIEISGVRSDEITTVQVTDESDNVLAPELGRTVTINGKLVQFCRVKLK